MNWFANKGQIIQISVAILALILAASQAWSKLQNNQFLSPGAILFYLLIFLVIVAASRGIHRSTSFSKDPDPPSNPRKPAITARTMFTDSKVNPLTYPLKLHLLVTNTERDPVAIESLSFEIHGSLRLAPNAHAMPGRNDNYYKPRFRVCKALKNGKQDDQYEDRCIVEPQKSMLAWVPIDPAIGEAALTAALNSKTAGSWHYKCVWLGDQITSADYEDKF